MASKDYPMVGDEHDDALDAVIVLGDAATLTRGGTSKSVEAKQTPYD